MADTPTSRVFRVRHRGAVAALKLLKPKGREEIAGARLMRWWDGAGTARVWELSDDAVLMEWLDGPSAGDMARTGQDDAATGILCDVLADLHRPRGAPPDLHDLAGWVRPLTLARAADWPPAFAEAALRLGHLLETAPDAVPLHGDFHHDNVMRSARGWLAMDPKGLIGDPAYDAANLFRNPLGASELALDAGRIARLADRVSARLGQRRGRVLDWAAAHCALAAVWNRSDGNPTGFDEALLPLLLAA